MLLSSPPVSYLPEATSQIIGQYQNMSSSFLQMLSLNLFIHPSMQDLIHHTLLEYLLCRQHYGPCQLFCHEQRLILTLDSCCSKGRVFQTLIPFLVFFFSDQINQKNYKHLYNFIEKLIQSGKIFSHFSTPNLRQISLLLMQRSCSPICLLLGLLDYVELSVARLRFPTGWDHIHIHISNSQHNV